MAEIEASEIYVYSGSEWKPFSAQNVFVHNDSAWVNAAYGKVLVYANGNFYKKTVADFLATNISSRVFGSVNDTVDVTFTFAPLDVTISVSSGSVWVKYTWLNATTVRLYALTFTEGNTGYITFRGSNGKTATVTLSQSSA